MRYDKRADIHEAFRSLGSLLRDLARRRQEIDQEIANLRPIPRLPSTLVEDRLSAWRRLLRSSATQARSVLQRVIRERIVFRPIDGTYEFDAPTSVQPDGPPTADSWWSQPTGDGSVRGRRGEPSASSHLRRRQTLRSDKDRHAFRRQPTASTGAVAERSVDGLRRGRTLPDRGRRVSRQAVESPQDERAWRYIDEDLSPKDKPRWSHDGRLLYFTRARGGLLKVWAVDFDPVSGAFGVPRQVTDFDGPGEQIPSVMQQFEIGVAPRGLLLPTIRPAGGIWLLHSPR